MPAIALQEVAIATTMDRAIVPCPCMHGGPWWGFANVADRLRNDRFIQRTVRMGYLPHGQPDA